MNTGVGLLILAMLLTPAADAVAKLMSADLGPLAIAFVRYLSAGLIAVAVARGVAPSRCRAPTASASSSAPR